MLETFSHLKQLRQGLHGEEKGGVGSARGVEDLSKVPVSEGRKLIHHHRKQWPILAVAFRLGFIALAYDELQILEEHFSQGAHRRSVLVDVQADEENELLVDDFVD